MVCLRNLERISIARVPHSHLDESTTVCGQTRKEYNTWRNRPRPPVAFPRSKKVPRFSHGSKKIWLGACIDLRDKGRIRNGSAATRHEDSTGDARVHRSVLRGSRSKKAKPNLTIQR